MPAGNDARMATTEDIVQAVLDKLDAQGKVPGKPRGMPQRRPGAAHVDRGDDWTCPRRTCGFFNFGRRKTCRECGLARWGTQPGLQRGQSATKGSAAAAAPAKGGGSSGGGGGVAASRSYAAVARQPAQPHEFVRRPGEGPTVSTPARPNSQPGVKSTWADITEDDPSTVVGKHQKQKGNGEVDEKRDADDVVPGDTDIKGDDDELEGLRSKLAKRKEVLDFMAQRGFDDKDESYASARKDVDALASKIAALEPKREKPYAVALLHAQKALDRANAARTKLDSALDELNREYEERLEQHAEKVVAADERVALHSKRVADLKASIGPQPPPRELGGNLLGAADSIQKCSTTLAAVFELAQANPAYGEHVGKVEGCKNLLNELHKLLVDSGGALRPDASAAPPTMQVQEPKGDTGDMDDDDEELRSQADSHGNPLPTEPPPPPAAAPPSPPASPPAAEPGNAQPPSHQVAPPPPQPSPPAAPTAGSPQPAEATARDEATARANKERVRAALAANPSVTKNRENIGKAKASSKVRNDKAKGAHPSPSTTGGATAPTPVRMVDTTEEAQNGDLIVDDEGGL